MSKQTQLPWASSSSSRGQRANGSSSSSSKDEHDSEMRETQPAAHLKHRTILKANRSTSVTPNLLSSSSTSVPVPPSAAVSVLGKRGGGRPSPFVFLDGEEPLDYTDFAQSKLAVHTLLYLCADQHYSNKHVTQPADDSEAEHSQPRDTTGSSGSSSSRMEVMEDGKDEKIEQLPAPPQPPQSDLSVRYDAIAPADDEHSPSMLLSHHPFHRFYRSHKAALAAWKQRQAADEDGSGGGGASDRVMEFACREPLHLLQVSAQQRAAVFASTSASASVSSSSSSAAAAASLSYLPSPPPLLSHLLSTHNGCVGYEVEGEEADGLVLTSYVCECQLSLLDDDKRVHVSQALLTDMFARLQC